MYTSALSASLCASGERPDDALDARCEGDTSIRALAPPAHAAAVTYRSLAFQIEYAKL
jgi:hypothetical protein